MIVTVSSGMFAAAVLLFIAHLLARRRIVAALRDQYPNVLAELEAQTTDRPRGAVNAFAWSGRHRELGDPDLSSEVRRFRVFAILGVMVFVAAPFAWMLV